MAVVACVACDRGGAGNGVTMGEEMVVADLDSIRHRGVLRVGTIESAYSYYTDGEGKEYGYDYDLSRAFADHLGLEYELVPAEGVEELIEMVESGAIDVAAYRMQMSQGNRKRVMFAGNVHYTRMVLVQRRSKVQVGDVTDLPGDTVYVREGTKYAKRMYNLNDELGGGIVVREVDDSVRTEMLIMAVSRGKIDYCVADEDLVRLLNVRLKNINHGVEVGHNGPKAWAVRQGADSLLAAFDGWYEEIREGRLLRLLQQKYIERNSFLKTKALAIPAGAISPYDDVFKEQAEVLGWDWRLLAALAWNESHFNAEAMSSQGAAGVMQMMPRTAARYGLTGDAVYDPKRNIEAGVQYIKRLTMMFSEVEDREERVKFILAGYNAGPGHVFDAMNLAEKYGAERHKWEGNVAEYLLKLKEKEYYEDEVCKHGFFRGKQTVRYVDKVYETYGKYSGEDREDAG